jgi:hypothetical protein
MILEIDDDFSDEITVNTLADSYASMQQMLKEGLITDEEDVDAYAEVMQSIMSVGSWFSIDFPAEIKKAKKRLK